MCRMLAGECLGELKLSFVDVDVQLLLSIKI